MADDKNLFNFGTGNIKRDQWLRDIDNEQDAFISRYTNATNKRKGLLLRLAFAELRKRIGSGDMLGRDDAGSFQFASSLNNEDKDVLEAQLRALGFMAELGRRLVQAPAAEPEKKKFEATTLEDAYKKHLFPGKFNETAYWDRDEAKRKLSLIDFLEGYTKEGALDSYLDFGDFESSDNLRARINTALEALKSGLEMDYNLGRLGFQGSWITKPLEDTSKSELELVLEDIAKARENDLVKQGRLYLSFNNSRGTQLFNITPSNYNFTQALQSYLLDNPVDMSKPVFAIDPKNALNLISNDYISKQLRDLDLYFKNFATSWRPNYESGENNQKVMQDYLSRLFSTYVKQDNKGLNTTDYAFDWKKYFTLIGDNQFLINGSIDKDTGRYAYYIPGKGIIESSIIDSPNQYVAQLLGYTLPSLKQGGKIEFLQNGGGFDFEAWKRANDPYTLLKLYNTKPTTTLKKLELDSDSNEAMDAGDWVTVAGTTIADIGSMLSANAPGYGTAASAVLGVTSTLGNSVNEFRHGNIGTGLFNLGIGLGADAVGLIPGVGAGTKSIKIGRTITRFARPLMAAMSASNLKEAADGVTVILKGLRNGFGSLTADDWLRLSSGLIATVSMVTRGKATNRRQNNVELYTRASQHSSPKDAKGNITKHIINEEGYIKARKELMNERPSIFNSTSKFSDRTWRSIPEGGEVNSPFFAHPIDWSNFGFGRQKKLDQLEKMENSLKGRKKKDSSLESSPLGNGSDAPVVVPNENVNEYLPIITGGSRPLPINGKEDDFIPLIEKGVKLKALRNGGIIKAQEGVKAGENYKDWYGLIYSSYGDDIINGLLNSKNIEADVLWLNNMQTDHASIYNLAKDTDYFSKAWKPSDNSVANYLAEYTGGGGFTNGKPGGFNDYGITTNWDKRYVFRGKRISGDKPKVFKNDNLFSAITDDRRLLGRLGDWTDENLNAFNDRIKSTGYRLELDPSDNYYKLKTLTDVGPVVKPRTTEVGTTKAGTIGSTGQQTAVDKLDPKASIYNTEFKNPMDPTPFITAGKTALGLFGNKDIYGNLLKEYPHPALQDPLHRQLAIVGDLRAIDDARNKLGDLRRILQQLIGYDPSRNFATSLETERVGRDVLDNGYNKDATRQFDTAQKLWNLKNEDTFTNWRTAYENRKAVENYNKTLAQIRAAWRSGNNNILMGAAADTGNWLMKKFQREQDTVDRARALALGTPEEWAQSEYTSRLGDLANKKASDMTEQEKAKAEAIKALVLREMRLKYSEKYYTNFNNGWFGGGYKEKLLGKNGTKLEVEKLKARSKDNDRYVSMIKDLRTTKRRRR